MTKYILSQLTQISVWIGMLVILLSCFNSREYIFILGILLLFAHDDSIKSWISKQVPWISETIKEWLDE